MRRTATLSMILAALLLGTGCSVLQVDSRDTSLDFFPPRKAPKDVVWTVSAPPLHETIGIVTVTTDRRYFPEDVRSRMQAEAAELGGDALTDFQSRPLGPFRVRHQAKVIVFR